MPESNSNQGVWIGGTAQSLESLDHFGAFNFAVLFVFLERFRRLGSSTTKAGRAGADNTERAPPTQISHEDFAKRREDRK
jgi:hypothetical protein